MQKLRNFFSKKKLVSYDSKSPNSARNAKKKFFWWQRKSAVKGGGGGPAAVFFKDTKTLANN